MTTTAAQATHAELLQHLAELLPLPFLVITIRDEDAQIQVRKEGDFDAWAMSLGTTEVVNVSTYEHNDLYWRQFELRADWRGFRVRLIRCEQMEVAPCPSP